MFLQTLSCLIKVTLKVLSHYNIGFYLTENSTPQAKYFLSKNSDVYFIKYECDNSQGGVGRGQ